MDQEINSTQAVAEIRFQQEWNLPVASNIHPLRYWSHVRFEGDPKSGQQLWTLFVELSKPPEPHQRIYVAKMFFVAPMAPHYLLQKGKSFELFIGSRVKAHGVVKEICAHS